MIKRTMDDRELLEAYARGRSEAAFGELVRRHLAWVHSVALRHTGNEALAKDVTQSVFVLLAQKAGRLRAGIVLGGWLFRTTRFVGNRALRAERRRTSREETAAAMIQSTTFPEGNEAVWKPLEPHLDQAVAALSEADRQAILLRFYEKKPLLEIGRQLGLSEEAAKKRVSRAIQKLRDFLVRRGVTVGGTLMAGLMAEHTVLAVPPGLAATVLKSAEVGTSASALLPQLAKETLNAWVWTKLKLAGGTVAVCGLVCWYLMLTQHPTVAFDSTSGLEKVERAGVQTARAVADESEAPATPTIATNERMIHFRLVAKGSGEPIPGARLAVNIVDGDEWKQRFDLVTDPTGGADVPYPSSALRLDIGEFASGWLARCATWHTDLDSEIPREYTMRVDPVTNFLGGWLVDEQGRPVANGVVEMYFGWSDMAQEENPRERPGFVGWAPASKSDPNGRWRCAVMDPHMHYFPTIRARHPDFAPTEIEPGKWGASPETQTDSIKLLWSGKLVTTLNRGVTLSGRILAEDGQSIGGARIEHSPASSEAIRTKADSAGGFTLPGLPPGAFDFIVTAPGFAQQYIQTNLADGMGPVEVRLKPGGRLRLRLVDEDGNPIANGRAALTGPGGMYMPGLSWKAPSGADGRIEWTSAPTNESLYICASKYPEFSMSRGAPIKADGEEHVIRLQRVCVVTGRITDARTGELIRKETKTFPGYGAGENSWWRGSTRLSTDGTFKVYFGEWNYPYRFRVEAEGYSPFVSDWLGAKLSNVVDVALQPIDPLRTVRGTVVRTDGQPAPGAEVALLSPEHGATLGIAGFVRRSGADRLILKANEAGNFAFPEEPDAAFVVAVCSNGFARLPVGDLKEPLELHLQPWGGIEGSIDPSACTRPVAQVMIDDLLSLDSPGSLRLDAQAFRSTPTDDGRFLFTFVPPELLCVWLDAGVIEDRSAPPYHHPTWVQVRAGETTNVLIARTGRQVKGRLVLPGHESQPFNKPLYATLESDWPVTSTRTMFGAKNWIRSFLDPGRLKVEPDGEFISRTPMTPGTYRLVGKLDQVNLDQVIEIPGPAATDFANLGSGFSDAEDSVVDLGEITVTEKEP